MLLLLFIFGGVCVPDATNKALSVSSMNPWFFESVNRTLPMSEKGPLVVDSFIPVSNEMRQKLQKSKDTKNVQRSSANIADNYNKLFANA
uniref:Secreted protein n=1 Tax=Steinernema glaseri TaxID=37863 RepID=A0A1I7Y7S8_9BILA